jgi:hypothetical protein
MEKKDKKLSKLVDAKVTDAAAKEIALGDAVRQRVLSNKKLVALYTEGRLGFKPLRQGVKEAVAWFQKEHKEQPPLRQQPKQAAK